MPVQYNGPSHGCENENFQVKNMIFFCYFCLKQRSRAPARTASLRRPQRAHISPVPCRSNNNNVYTPENPTFYIKYGSRGPKSHRNASLRYKLEMHRMFGQICTVCDSILISSSVFWYFFSVAAIIKFATKLAMDISDNSKRSFSGNVRI